MADFPKMRSPKRGAQILEGQKRYKLIGLTIQVVLHPERFEKEISDASQESA